MHQSLFSVKVQIANDNIKLMTQPNVHILASVS